MRPFHRPLLCLALLWAPAAHATQWYNGATAADAGNWVVTSDSAVTVGSTGSVFGAESVTAAVTDTLGQSGFRVRTEAVAGRYEYKGSGGQTVVGRQVEGSALGGYEWVGDRSSVAAYLGFLARDNAISVYDPGNREIGTAFGVKGVIEAYLQPTDRTMVAAHGSYATAYNAYFGRVRLGYDLGNHVFVGPEFSALGDDFFRQWRIGAHASGLRVGPMEVALSAGLLQDNKQGLGAYTTVDARFGF